MGKRNAPTYRIIAMESQRKRDGRALEIIGHYNPQLSPPLLSYKKERIKFWIKNGAKMTESVKKLIEGKYEFVPYVPKRKKGEKEENTEDQQGQKEKKAVDKKPGSKESQKGKESLKEEKKDS